MPLVRERQPDTQSRGTRRLESSRRERRQSAQRPSAYMRSARVITNEADRRLTPAPASNPYAREGATSQAAVGSGRVGSELREACLARGWRQVVEAGSPKQYLVSAPDSRSDGGARRVQPLQRLPDAEGRVRSCAGARGERYGAMAGRCPRPPGHAPAGPKADEKNVGHIDIPGRSRHAQPQHPT